MPVIYICTVYGTIANVVQTVDVLPWEKYDTFIHLIKMLRDMLATIKESNCPECKGRLTASDVTEVDSNVEVSSSESEPSDVRSMNQTKNLGI